ncbi:ABC transporter permease [Danxiaibacter flavus]|uniref:ABC transporter permease n=1 Tax=Danxiaibacter flavus TaxID=3049108 RepID=A0ABV3ZJ75_9BACT|nr:ABC transporter permease [Chitinophagaceae bacterium DXS]
MFGTYFKTAWRNLTKNRLNAFINTAGLSVAFICCILLSLTVYYEFSYDKFHKNAPQLYKVYALSHTATGDEKNGTMSYPAAPSMKANVPGIIKSTGVIYGGTGIMYKEKEVDKNILLVDNDFFSMFTFPVINGNANAPLAGIGDVAISQTAARAVFGNENPVGKLVRVKISGEWKELAVSSVLADFPDNSTLRYDILARMELSGDYASNKNNWNNQNHPVYVQINPNTTQQQVENGLRNMVKQFHLADEKDLTKRGFRKDENGDMFAFKLAPFTSLHFDQEIGSGGTVSKPYLYTLVLIAILVLVIACFNFINLNVARAFTRAREVGVRKTIGAGKKQIFLQLWVESFMLCLIALVIALAVSYPLLTPFNALFVEKLKLTTLIQPAVIVSVMAGVVLVSFLAGGYPAWMVSRFKTVEVLKGKVSVNRSVYLRNSLITFQFVMASLLICGTFIIYRQFDHLRAAPLGFEQENIISIPIKNKENSSAYIRQLRASLASNPEVVSISGSSGNIGIGLDHSQSTMAMGFDYEGRQIFTNLLTVDYDFVKTLGVKLISGREFTPEFTSDTSTATDGNVVVTESMAKQFGKSDALGITMTDTSGPHWTIVGIIPDFHLFSMNEKMMPLTLTMNKHNQIGYMLVKVKTGNPARTMETIRATYKTIEPDNTLTPSYVNENTERWYEKEQRLSKIFFTSAAIAVLLSCLGLFAIVTLVMQQRRKEIGVRKVLGASIAQITSLLSKEFLFLVLLAFAIATPIAWYFLNQWLQNFPYRINISWWIFPVACIVVLLIAFITISVQTIRASLANPVKSLRTE